MRIFISAGEASGDLHAAALTREILSLAPDAEVFGMGGDALRSAGGEVIFDYKDNSVMGFVEVLRKLPDLFRLRDAFRQVMVERKPDIFVTVDYPDFNMRVAKVAKQLGIPVFSFIPPSAWAWRRGRAKMVARLAARVACIYPFAYEVYKEAGAPVEFVGNPLVDIVKPTMSQLEAQKAVGKRPGHPLILLLPGSRQGELRGVLPVMHCRLSKRTSLMRISFSKRRPMWIVGSSKQPLIRPRFPSALSKGIPMTLWVPATRPLLRAGPSSWKRPSWIFPASSVTRQVPSAWPLLKPSSK